MIAGGWVLSPALAFWPTPRTKDMNYLEKIWENSFRNPTPYLRGLFKQPVKEVHPNPDYLVRTNGQMAADRLMVSGPYIEWWKLEQRDNSKRFKKHPYFEKRIGWKFVDGEETFYPTLQWHLSK